MKHTVTIEKIIAGGKGLARLDTGKVIMVAEVLPGEVVTCFERTQHQGYIKADLIKVVAPSPERKQAACPYYLECGGCDLQHCTYELQLAIKKNIVGEALNRAGVTCAADCLQTPLPSPEQLAYRYRLRMKVNADGQLGFHKKKTNTFVPVQNCPIATDTINAAISFVQSTQLLHQPGNVYNEIEFFLSPADNSLTLLLQRDNDTDTDLQVLTGLSECPEIDQVADKVGRDIQATPSLRPLQQSFFLHKLHSSDYSLSWSAGCFSQINAIQNQRLVQLVCTLAGNVKNTTILELYCGMGNFSIPLALQGAAVTGIELNRESIRWTKRNAETAGIKCHFFAADVVNSLRQLVQEQQQVDTILLDPPRRGLGKSTGLLPKLKPQKIIYISCDPATMARDLAQLGKQGYSLIHLTPVDMFPQTHHIESVALLEKN